MRPFAELTNQAKAIEIIRWLGVLPAAVLGFMVTRLVIGALIRSARHAEFSLLNSSPFDWMATSLFHALFAFIFVLAGTIMAPRRQAGTAVVLAIAVVLLSFATHLFVQYLAGNRVGPANYVHCGAETVGAAAAAVCVLCKCRAIPSAAAAA